MSDVAPTAWQRAWDNAQPRLAAINETISSYESPTSRVLRVGQLDAELLDAELVQILREPIAKSLSLIHSSFRSRFNAELALFIQLVLYKLSVWDSGASYGAKIQGLRYKPHSAAPRLLAKSGLLRRVLLVHGALTIIVPYLHARVRARALSEAWPDAPSSDRRRRMWDTLVRVESLHSTLALVNFVLFLCNGRYRTLIDRLLRLKLVPAQRLMKRQVSYEFMNRQMVWHAFTEFLLFLLPLINIRSLQRRVSPGALLNALFSFVPTSFRGLLGTNHSGTSQFDQTGVRKPGKYHALPEDQCSICADAASYDVAHLGVAADSYVAAAALSAPANTTSDAKAEVSDETSASPAFPLCTPYMASCGHAYCYVCLADAMLRSRDMGAPPWTCLRCSAPVLWAERPLMDGADSTSDRTASNSDGASEFSEMDTDALGESASSLGSFGDANSEPA